MYARREKTACLAIVIMLLLSEIYLDMVMTDSFFVYNSVEEIDTYICATNTLRECVGIELQSAGWNLFPCLLYIGYLFLLQGKFILLSEIIQNFCRTLDAFVTEYMHQSDGKKRIIPRIDFIT